MTPAEVTAKAVREVADGGGGGEAGGGEGVGGVLVRWEGSGEKGGEGGGS